MDTNLREAVHKAADKLPENRLAEVLNMMQMLIDAGNNPDVEPEELWLLTSGKLKAMVDEIEDAPAPVDDWQKWIMESH
jgi:hypothetical protein